MVCSILRSHLILSEGLRIISTRCTRPALNLYAIVNNYTVYLTPGLYRLNQNKTKAGVSAFCGRREGGWACAPPGEAQSRVGGSCTGGVGGRAGSGIEWMRVGLD